MANHDETEVLHVRLAMHHLSLLAIGYLLFLARLGRVLACLVMVLIDDAVSSYC